MRGQAALPVEASYLELEHRLPEKLLAVKITEVLEILRGLNPNSDAVLADFSEPGKLNLVEFMETNYMFNISLAKFSYLTGRSLTTFKRDFKKAFFTGQQSTSTVEEAGQRIVKYALLGPDGPTGQYFSEEYFPAPATCPW